MVPQYIFTQKLLDVCGCMISGKSSKHIMGKIRNWELLVEMTMGRDCVQPSKGWKLTVRWFKCDSALNGNKKKILVIIWRVGGGVGHVNDLYDPVDASDDAEDRLMLWWWWWWWWWWWCLMMNVDDDDVDDDDDDAVMMMMTMMMMMMMMMMTMMMMMMTMMMMMMMWW